MKTRVITFLVIIFSIAINRTAFAQLADRIAAADTFQINITNEYKIRSINIIPFSERVFLQGKILDRANYNINYERGIISLSIPTDTTDTLSYSLLDTLIITYESVKLSLKKEYKRRSLVIDVGDKFSDTVKIIKEESAPLTTESIFGKNIQKSGALIRGFTVGTNRDFQLNSGLRLQLSGKLSEDIELTAALTDENTPIQPEGNTETLDELDKVFIELKHKNAIGTFGDYELIEKGNEFGQITRKLQGLKGEVNFENHHGVISVAGSRGKFNTNQFSGQDGNQGPYRLYGVNNERSIIIIAGSERVYFDGELLKRGENNDYVIDYSNAEITFTPKRLITSARRLVVDFEYTDQNFKRNFFGANYSTSLLDDNLKFGISYYREGDDENNPIDASFGESDLEILRDAGDDRNTAVRSGVSIAEPDSLGRIIGTYSKVDTVINSQPFTYYVYSPGTAESIYNVSFSYVGSGGDYMKESLGKYKFVGIGSGTYLPIVYLPLPELKQVGNFFFQTKIADAVKINLELSGSSRDKNLLSNNDDSDNIGYARKFLIELTPKNISLGDLSLGKIGLSYKDRFIQSRYNSLDRIDEADFNRYYNLSSSTVSTKPDQILREAGLDLFPNEQLVLNFKYGFLKQGESFHSDRFYSLIKFEKIQDYHFDYNIDYVSTTNLSVKSNWNRQNGKANYSLGSFTPGVDFLYENKEEINADTLLATSLRYLETSPYLEYSAGNFNIIAGYSYREESSPFKKEMTVQSKSYTQQLQANFKGVKEFTTSLSFTFRNKKITKEFKTLGYGDNETILFLSQSRFNLWNNFISGDLYYQAATEQSARLEKVFVKVEKGTGNYIYLGDLNDNGIAEENEFQLTSYDGEFILVTVPTDQLFPVIDLKTNARVKIDLDKVIKGKSFWDKAIKSISTETSWRIDENSKLPDTKQIYLLNLSRFLNDSTTIRGTQLFQHDFHFFQNNSEFSVRLRYLQRKSLNQYSAGLERGYFRERGIRIRFKMITEINNQTEFFNQNDNLVSPPTSGRERTINKNELTTEFSYRPIKNVETGFKIQTGRSEDFYPPVPTIIDMNSLTLKIAYSIANLGRLRLEGERSELTANTASKNIPYEITRGNVIGKNYFWRVFFDYRIAGYIQTSFSYDGRLQGSGRVIHTMKAEARAYF